MSVFFWNPDFYNQQQRFSLHPYKWLFIWYGKKWVPVNSTVLGETDSAIDIGDFLLVVGWLLCYKKMIRWMRTFGWYDLDSWFWGRWVSHWGHLMVAQMVNNLPSVQETWVQSMGREDSLEKGMATHSSILAWRILWIEKLGGLQSMGLKRVRHDWATKHARRSEKL